MQATLGSTIALEKCTSSACLPTTKGRNLLGMVVFTLNDIPVRIKMPAMMAQKNPPHKISKEDARNLIVNQLVARRFHGIDWVCVMELHMCLNRWA